MLEERRPASRYVVEAEIASGGMGVVYRVFDRQTREVRALKRVKIDDAQGGYSLEAFEREYQVLSSVDHPRIIRVFEYGVDEQGPYYTMELLQGQDLRGSAPIPYQKACLYLRDVATSLSLLHARRLLHRDLSPGNVRMTPDGHCKLLDFGALSPFGASRVVVGTPPFVPPEAVRGTSLDQRADLYALGALAYWMLTGRHAYPARHVKELPELWRAPLPPPSALAPGVPAHLDHLVLSLLRADPLARPASAAEVIAKLNVVGELAPEDTTQTARIAHSFLLNPRFTGRTSELATLDGMIEAAVRGQGGAMRIEAAAGMGRTRLLDEVEVLAQLAGATVVRADAATFRNLHGTSRAIAMRLFEERPERARELGAQYAHALSSLGPDLAERLGAQSSESASSAARKADASRSLEAWFLDLSRDKPLVIEVDNVDFADDASLGLLAALARAAPEHALLIVVTARLDLASKVSVGLNALRNHSGCLSLSGLEPPEMLDLVRSLFGDAPNAERFAGWLHEKTAGSPLHAVEIARQLVAKEVVHYTGGVWTLPVDRPDAELPAALGDALAMRIATLSPAARALSECLALQRHRPTLELCRKLTGSGDERETLALLDELSSKDVLHPENEGYRFSSLALREALLARMAPEALEVSHKKLGAIFAELAGDADPSLRIEAGYHLIRGGDDLVGAALIADVANDPFILRTLFADVQRIGKPIDAALKVYRRHRLSVYRRLPLLAAVAQAGYYEERSWGERYGDAALDILDDLSGLRTARRLKRFCGARLSLVLGLLFAWFRFLITPKRERPYPFSAILIHLFGVVTTMTGAASLSLDSERADRVAEILEPFSALPERLTPRGIYDFCRSLREIGRDNPAAAYETFERLCRRFEDPRYYPSLPADGRKLYVAAAHFARGSFAVFRADGRAALESADALDATGLKLYAMIASQLRFLYYVNRGEFAKAAPHREQVELAAAHVGSIWQVETWEAAALILVHTALDDVVGSTRIARQLEVMSRSVPSLRHHSLLARQGLLLASGDHSTIDRVVKEHAAKEPRSYIGWAATQAFLARGYNDLGRHADARELCARALETLTDADRQYVSLFLHVDIEAAIADAGLGRHAEALSRIDELLARFDHTDHPLVHGLLHEARARVCLAAGDKKGFQTGLTQVERWFHPTKTPQLRARCEKLSQLVEEISHVRHSRPAEHEERTVIESPGRADQTQTVVNTEVDVCGAKPS